MEKSIQEKASAQLSQLYMPSESVGSQEWKEAEGNNYRIIKRREEFTDEKSSVNVFSGGFFFATKDVKKGVAYVRCTEDGCGARGTIRVEGGIGEFGYIKKYSVHNHILDHVAKVALMEAYKDLKSRVLKHFMTDTHSVYRQWLVEQEDEDIIAELSWDTVDSTLKRLRQSRFPKCQTQAEFHDLLENNLKVREDFFLFKGTELYQGMALGSAVFVNEKIMNNIPKNTKTNWYFDGTFKIQPLDFKQLFIGHVEIEGRPHAAVYVLMNSMDQKHYEHVFCF